MTTESGTNQRRISVLNSAKISICEKALKISSYISYFEKNYVLLHINTSTKKTVEIKLDVRLQLRLYMPQPPKAHAYSQYDLSGRHESAQCLGTVFTVEYCTPLITHSQSPTFTRKINNVA